MKSSKVPLKPTPKTYNLLYGKSGNRCAYGKCTTPITHNLTLVGEVAHIKAESPGGPRYDPAQTDDERRDYSNLILLCSVHHKIVDDDDEIWTVEALQQLKRKHESRVVEVPSDQLKKEVDVLIAGDMNVVNSGSNSGVIAGFYQVNHHYRDDPPILETPSFPEISPKDGFARFREPGERLGVKKNFAPFGQTQEEHDVMLMDGPALWLRLIPHFKLERDLRFAELERFAFKLNTMMHSADGTVTAPDGFGRYFGIYGDAAHAISFFFRNGEIWSVELTTFFEHYNRKCFAFAEATEALFRSLTVFGEIMKEAGIPPPYKWIAGVEGVHGILLNSGNPNFSGGVFIDNTRFMADVAMATGEYSPGQEPAEALDEFIQVLFDESGKQRPEHLIFKR